MIENEPRGWESHYREQCAALPEGESGGHLILLETSSQPGAGGGSGFAQCTSVNYAGRALQIEKTKGKKRSFVSVLSDPFQTLLLVQQSILIYVLSYK